MSTHLHFGDLATQTTKRLALSLILTAAFVVIEIVAGIFGNRLALLTNARRPGVFHQPRHSPAGQKRK